MTRKAMSAGTNSATLGMRMSGPTADSSASDTTGADHTATPVAPARAASFLAVLFMRASNSLVRQPYFTMRLTTKPMRASASTKAEPRMKTVNRRPWTSG